MTLDNNTQAFLALVRAGLWEADTQLLPYGIIDFKEVYRLAQEQSVVGLVAAGLEHVVDYKVPKEDALIFVGDTLLLEQRNKAMNAFVAHLIDTLRKKDIYTLLVKGQGIAQCYWRPLWRACGDIDLFLNEDKYKKAKTVLTSEATSFEEEKTSIQHLEMTIDGWSVELHGSLRSGLWNRLDRGIDEAQQRVFCGGNVRSWMNDKTQVFLPGADEDVVFVFSHILQHFYSEGIGMRQICDWCRLLWTYRETIDKQLLLSRLKKMGTMSEWRSFATLAVDTLGMPVNAMPFYSPNKRWKHKADKILAFIIETGNFGHNRDYSYYKKHPYLVYKCISLWRHTQDGFRYFYIFPLDACKVWCQMIGTGISWAVRRK